MHEVSTCNCIFSINEIFIDYNVGENTRAEERRSTSCIGA